MLYLSDEQIEKIIARLSPGSKLSGKVRRYAVHLRYIPRVEKASNPHEELDLFEEDPVSGLTAAFHRFTPLLPNEASPDKQTGRYYVTYWGVGIVTSNDEVPQNIVMFWAEEAALRHLLPSKTDVAA